MVNESPGRGTGAGAEADLAVGQLGCHVQPKHGVDVRILQGAVANHRDRPAWRQFLRWLEEHLHGACKGVPLSDQPARQAEEHGRVGIVAARVHDSG
jgi:hypothetical protein